MTWERRGVNVVSSSSNLDELRSTVVPSPSCNHGGGINIINELRSRRQRYHLTPIMAKPDHIVIPQDEISRAGDVNIYEAFIAIVICRLKEEVK
ncbi:hypothetical protein PIB30_089973, partial [Stylosanthes scabra]|nr:hypothetical protein [Stylosanthes scabra]